MNSEIVAFVVVLAYFLLHFTWLLSPPSYLIYYFAFSMLLLLLVLLVLLLKVCTIHLSMYYVYKNISYTYTIDWVGNRSGLYPNGNVLGSKEQLFNF